MKAMALGRGLDALFGEIEKSYENEGTQKDEVSELSVDDIKPNPFQPRKIFDEESLFELSESIKNDGLLQPIIVKEDIDSYILIAGERRLRASRLAKLETIRCIIIHIDDDKMRKLALIENIQREDLNSIELAKSYEELIKIHEITHQELSNMIHKSRTHITNTLRLLQLSIKTQKALLEKKITAGHAKVLVCLDEKQQQVIVNSIIGQKLSVREVETMIKGMKEEISTPIKLESTLRYDFSDLEEKFYFLGFNIKTSSNKATIEFESEEQINKFLKYFSS